MIISFAFGLIGAILIFVNNKYLRTLWVFLIGLAISLALAATGFYLIRHSAEETDTRMLFPFFTPLVAIFLLWITRIFYKVKTKREVIFHVYGLFPIKHYERHVTREEKMLTYFLLILSVCLSYLIVLFL